MLHRPVKKRLARNPYTVHNVMAVWECDLVDVMALGKYNDKYVYILSVTDIFSKFLHLVPLRSKPGTAVSSAFQSIFMDPRYSTRRPIWLRTNKGKEFLNRQFQDMLKREGIQFQINPRPSNELIGLSAIGRINILPIKIRTDI